MPSYQEGASYKTAHNTTTPSYIKGTTPQCAETEQINHFGKPLLEQVSQNDFSNT